MANSKLLGKRFPIPDKILYFLNLSLKKYSDKTKSKGYKRAYYLVTNKNCSYEQLKRIKNYFDYLDWDNIDEVEFNLNGGELMFKWVTETLKNARDNVKNTKIARTNASMSDQFREDGDITFNNDTAPPKITDYPDIMGNPKLLEEVNKIKTIINKIL